MRLRRRQRRPIHYSHHMPDYIRAFSICGLSSDAEVAEVLAREFDSRIVGSKVSEWRKEYPDFNSAVVGAVQDLQAQAITVIGKAIQDGDLSAAKWLLERRNSLFKPSSKIEHDGRIEGIDARIAARLAEDELREMGVILDDEEDYREKPSRVP